MADASRKIMAASFLTPDGGSRGGGAVGGAFPDKVGNVAVLHVKPDGKAKLIPVRWLGPDDGLRRDAPVWLVTGRVLQHYQSGAQTRLVGELAAAAGEMFVQLHPDTARAPGVGDGELVDVVSRRGRTRATARLDDDMRADVVFLPFHWAGDARANSVTHAALDPTSRMPEFKACAVRLEAVS